eukprot:TRINITY_DN7465_c0_g1_i1.p1 TRINITY_DN7465_c0_g1~~TRINITY_DN7465_c0_g1_i1.p1  ORF type:complete len:245 (-),score=36.53 TRINITY_DN7465_c0_g1_i1:172-906(-)
MSKTFWREIRECFQQIGNDTEWRCVLLTAAGRMFTAGLDLPDHASGFFEQGDDVGRTAYHQRRHVLAYQESFTAIEECPIPVISCVHGGCYGGGVDLICASDIRLCSCDAVFCIKEVDVGLAADVGTLQRLPKIVGNESLVREWAFTARMVSAQEALQCGLVSRVLPDHEQLRKAGLELAATIASKSPIAVAGTKRNLVFSRDHTVKDGLEYVATWNAAQLQSSDVPTAISAGMAKEKAVFSKL